MQDLLFDQIVHNGGADTLAIGTAILTNDVKEWWPIAAWILCPPFWFWASYRMTWLLVDDDSLENESEKHWRWDHFKHGQQIAASIWLAISVMLLAYVSVLREAAEK